MSVFGLYAEYYDRVYRDKDYNSEAKFVHGLLQQYNPGAKSILDLGCGTGRHAVQLAEIGYLVQAVDLSPRMIQAAQRRKEQLPCEIQERVSFIEADIRRVHFGVRYDAVVSLFHVLSYQVTDEDVMMVLTTASQHLSPAGVCLFDFWYGPAVLSDPPVVRVRRLEEENLKIVRITEPKLYPNENLVDVDYLFFVQENNGTKIRDFAETHRMRYFFLPELHRWLKLAGLNLLKSREWLTENAPGTHTWSVYVAAQLRSE
jgi:SAM-dependent methyltransferase